MTYRVVSESPDTFLVDPAQIDCRIDAHYFRPSFVRSARKVEELADGCTERLHKLTKKIGQPRDIREFVNEGVPILNAKNVRVLKVDSNGAPLVPHDVAKEHQKQMLSGDEVLVVRTGANCGDVAWAGPMFRGQLVNSHVIPIRTKSGLTGSFLAAYLATSLGQSLLQREMTGAAQRQVSVASLNATQVPSPDRRIQEYIGASIELAECCRSKSIEARTTAVASLLENWAFSDIQAQMIAAGAAKAHYVSPARFDNRLDAEFYQPKFIAMESWLDEHECWTLGDLVHSPVKGVQPSYDVQGTIPALTVTHIDPFAIDRAGAVELVTGGWLADNPRAAIKAGEILFTVTGPPLGETVAVEEFHLPSAINSHVARIRPKDSFPYPNLLAGMLNTQLGQLLTTRYCKGIRQKELYPVDLLRFRFPILPPKLVKQAERQFRLSCLLVERARQLVEGAKHDVEAFIEGSLDTKGILAGRVKPPTAEEVLGAIEAEVLQ